MDDGGQVQKRQKFEEDSLQLKNTNEALKALLDLKKLDPDDNSCDETIANLKKKILELCKAQCADY